MTIRDFINSDNIEGVVVRELTQHCDKRGWLVELWRHDEQPKYRFNDLLSIVVAPRMAYASMTQYGKTRGPHEHAEQTDWFCFVGPSDFLIVLWDNRPASPTYRHRMQLTAGATKPAVVIVPPGVVHGYRCIGSGDPESEMYSPDDGLVINLPDALYAGWKRESKVDEIRHEADPDSPFKMPCDGDYTLPAHDQEQKECATLLRCSSCGAPCMYRKKTRTHSITGEPWTWVQERYVCSCDGSDPFRDDGEGRWSLNPSGEY